MLQWISILTKFDIYDIIIIIERVPSQALRPDSFWLEANQLSPGSKNARPQGERNEAEQRTPPCPDHRDRHHDWFAVYWEVLPDQPAPGTPMAATRYHAVWLDAEPNRPDAVLGLELPVPDRELERGFAIRCQELPAVPTLVAWPDRGTSHNCADAGQRSSASLANNQP